jgi:hypothetical protein
MTWASMNQGFSENFTPTHVAVFKGTAFPVCLSAITTRCPMWADAIYSQRGQAFNISPPGSGVSVHAFKQFVCACESRPITPSRTTCYDLFLLAHQFHAETVMTDLVKAVEANPADLAASALRFSHDFDSPMSFPFERLLKSHFLSCQVDDLARLDISILSRIIRFPPRSEEERFNAVFDLVSGLYERVGPVISIESGAEQILEHT